MVKTGRQPIVLGMTFGAIGIVIPFHVVWSTVVLQLMTGDTGLGRIGQVPLVTI